MRGLRPAVVADIPVGVMRCGQVGGNQTFTFVAVILDCLGDAARAFYQHWDFEELPGHPYRLFLGAKRLDALMEEP